jgi:hypothetical protein
MWTFFYKSKDRLRDIALQINPNLKAEFTSFIEDEGRIDGEIEGKTAALLSSIFGFSAKIGAGKKSKNTTEIKSTINEDAVINSLDSYFPKNKYSILSKNTKIEELDNLKKLIRITGTFKININGKNHFERVANFQTAEYVKWTSCFKNINVSFITTKDSYTSSRPSPIAQGLANNSKSFEIDGFGTLQRCDGNLVEISPLFLGSQFDL